MRCVRQMSLLETFLYQECEKVALSFIEDARFALIATIDHELMKFHFTKLSSFKEYFLQFNNLEKEIR
jgi:hypothetical protein